MTVQERVRRATSVPSPTGPPLSLQWPADLDFTRLSGLPDDGKMCVIIRVLCGLVALEETGHPSTLDRGESPPVDLAPKRRRLLPFFGYGRQASEPTTSVTEGSRPTVGAPDRLRPIITVADRVGA